ncbi:MAG: hypothetical protein HKO65_18880 [Gemmatimonadetes bacterium]|nr:hypothetical protein [Gemmatimonadota bacterium]NNM07164.1 hypothetical protein [Gemmatimonadota bacterium]
MTISNGSEKEPLWLVIERKISELGDHDLAEDNLEKAIQQVAAKLDQTGFAVSGNAGHMLALRNAVGARVAAGRPLMEDLNKAFGALSLGDLTSPYVATVKLVDKVGEDWPALKTSERRTHVDKMVRGIKLDLLVAKAKGVDGDGGIRLLIEEDLDPAVIIDRMGIDQAEFDRVIAAVAAERAERVRVAELLDGVSDRPQADQIRHLITSDVSEELIIELGGADQAAIADVKRAMEEEIAEKKRLAEEEAARKAAEAAGPSLGDIAPDDMLEYIESIREILDFSDVEKEIRVMCEQSGIPKDLVEIAVSDPDKLDELETEAEG